MCEDFLIQRTAYLQPLQHQHNSPTPAEHDTGGKRPLFSIYLQYKELRE